MYHPVEVCQCPLLIRQMRLPCHINNPLIISQSGRGPTRMMMQCSQDGSDDTPILLPFVHCVPEMNTCDLCYSYVYVERGCGSSCICHAKVIDETPDLLVCCTSSNALGTCA